jgi:EAL domain-containing protein (putative c-di-GMP-specific phosphodiesterase class I)
MTARALLSAEERGFADLLDARAVRAAFHPIIDLADGGVLGYEALARGPRGSSFESPAALFTTAYRTGRVAELDWACRAAAYTAALEAGLPGDCTLFVNTEPVSVASPCPPDLRDLIERAERELRVVVEVTERAVAADPAALLAAAARIHASGWGVALDDVGAEPASLAVMPFVDPDVIKLDLRLIQERGTPETARIVNAVRAQAERTGAVVLAEGIETTRHEQVARAMGATAGQGWLYGRPGPLPPGGPGRAGAAGHVIVRALRRTVPAAPGATPFELVSAERPTAATTKELLLPMSRYLEQKGLDADEPLTVLACFQHERHLTPLSRRRYAELAGRAPLTAALGVGIPPRPVPGVLGTALDPADPLSREWNVVAIGPHFAGALVARDLGGAGPDPERRFDYVVTHDRELVVAAARAMLAKVVPPSTARPSAQR